MVLRKPLFQAESESQLYQNLCKLLGTPEQDWIHPNKFPYFKDLHKEGEEKL